MNKEKLYDKIAVFPKKLFGNNLSEIILEGERLNPIEKIPEGQTCTYALRILVDLPPREIEKYAEEVAAYYKNKTENTRFKLEATIINTFYYKLRNHFIVPIENIILYRKEPYFSGIHAERHNQHSRFSVKKTI